MSNKVSWTEGICISPNVVDVTHDLRLRRPSPGPHSVTGSSNISRAEFTRLSTSERASSIMPHPASYATPRPSVHFASRSRSSPRQPRQDELFLIKDFTRHVGRCQSCLVTESRSVLRCALCPRGRDYGNDLLPYLAHENGRCVSVVDHEQGWGLTEVIIPSEYRTAEIFLRCKGVRCPRRSSTWSSPPQHRSVVVVPRVTLTPEVSCVQDGPGSGETIVHVTIPAFTIPVRLDTTRP